MTGSRIGELLALRWQDIDLQGEHLSVRQTVYEGHFDEPKTRQSKRRIPLGPKMCRDACGLEANESGSSGFGVFARNDSRLVGAICLIANSSQLAKS
jgi:integrase